MVEDYDDSKMTDMDIVDAPEMEGLFIVPGVDVLLDICHTCTFRKSMKMTGWKMNFLR